MRKTLTGSHRNLTVCVIGIIAVAADDATGVRVVDDFLFSPLGAGIGKDLIMVM